LLLVDKETLARVDSAGCTRDKQHHYQQRQVGQPAGHEPMLLSRLDGKQQIRMTKEECEEEVGYQEHSWQEG
jgi:hypothetical protein